MPFNDITINNGETYEVPDSKMPGLMRYLEANARGAQGAPNQPEQPQEETNARS